MSTRWASFFSAAARPFCLVHASPRFTAILFLHRSPARTNVPGTARAIALMVHASVITGFLASIALSVRALRAFRGWRLQQRLTPHGLASLSAPMLEHAIAAPDCVPAINCLKVPLATNCAVLCMMMRCVAEEGFARRCTTMLSRAKQSTPFGTQRSFMAVSVMPHTSGLTARSRVVRLATTRPARLKIKSAMRADIVTTRRGSARAKTGTRRPHCKATVL